MKTIKLFLNFLLCLAVSHIDAATVASVSDIQEEKIYTISTSTRGAIVWDGTSGNLEGSMKISVTLDASNPNHQFTFIKTGTNKVFMVNIGADKFVYQNGKKATLAEKCVSWTLKNSGDSKCPLMIDASSGDHWNIGGTNQITIDNWGTKDAGNCFMFEEVGDVDETYVEELKERIAANPIIQEGKIYTISTNGRGAIVWNGSSGNLNGSSQLSITLDTSNPNHQFTFIRTKDDVEKFYMVNIGADKFVRQNSKNAALVDVDTSAVWTIKYNGNSSYPLMIDAASGNHWNLNTSGQILIDSWGTKDAGNCFNFEVVGVADEAYVDELKERLWPTPSGIVTITDNNDVTTVTKVKENDSFSLSDNIKSLEITEKIANVNFSYTRSFDSKMVGNWQAWYMPCDFAYDDLKADFDVAQIAGVLLDGNGQSYIAFKKMSGGKIKAHIPYIVRTKKIGETTITATTTLYPTNVSKNFYLLSAFNKFTFGGVYENTYLSAEYPTYAMTKTGNFAMMGETVYLRPLRIYMRITDRDDNPYTAIAVPQEVKIVVLGEDETSVDEIHDSQFIIHNDDSSEIFNLAGQKLQKLQKGINIVNGRKVMY